MGKKVRIVGLCSLLWIVMASSAMAARPGTQRIWATSGNSWNDGVSQTYDLVGNSASFYLWIELPYLVEEDEWGFPPPEGSIGPDGAVRVSMEFMISKAVFSSDGTAWDYRLSCDQNPVLASGQNTPIYNLVSGDHGTDTSSSVTWSNLSVRNGTPSANITSTAIPAGIYCLGLITFTDVDAAVNEINFTLGSGHRIEDGAYSSYSEYFSNYQNIDLFMGDKTTGTLGSTIAIIQRAPAIPEPSSYAMLTGLGIISMTWYRYRRRAK